MYVPIPSLLTVNIFKLAVCYRAFDIATVYIFTLLLRETNTNTIENTQQSLLSSVARVERFLDTLQELSIVTNDSLTVHGDRERSNSKLAANAIFR
jgi:hypothetical protein